MKYKKKYIDLQNDYALLYSVNESHKKLNGRLRRENDYLGDKNYKMIRYIKELESEVFEYKEKIDKAIEYIKYNNEDLYTFDPDYDYEEELVDNYEPSNYREDLLEILKGDSNE